ncbi:hypothetical protein BG005_011781 [Podila minutissima]|nr:hypothetical protein BG005_011781 [Podila minutissima]
MTQSAPTPNPSSLVQHCLACLKDWRTQDFVFTFEHPETHMLVCLFSHQDWLARLGNFARRFNIPKPRSSRDSPLGRRDHGTVAKFKAYSTAPFKTVGFLLANCAMLKYIYTGQVSREVDLREFFFTAGDNRTLAEKTVSGEGCSGFLDELLAIPLRVANKEDIIKAATFYELPDLVKKCREEL